MKLDRMDRSDNRDLGFNPPDSIEISFSPSSLNISSGDFLLRFKVRFLWDAEKHGWTRMRQ
jgi:hypothetical protein